MNTVREIQRLNELELERQTPPSASWHTDYASSAWIYVGGLPYELTEGDLIAICSQFGEVADDGAQLVRDRDTGRSKGFAFVKYEDQRSTVLAVDNLVGAKVLGRTLRVDHVRNYRPPKHGSDNEDDDAANEDEQRVRSNEGKQREEPPENIIREPYIKREEDVSPQVKLEPQSDDDGLDPDDPMREYIRERRREERKGVHAGQRFEHSRRDKEEHSRHRQERLHARYDEERHSRPSEKQQRHRYGPREE